jgi:uncharacterized protein YbjT (DUF2867 family)
MSVLAAAIEPGIQLGRWHRTVERYLMSSGLDWTIARPGPFMQNFLGMYPASEDGFRLPVGKATVNHIDVSDVAKALAAIIKGTEHSERIYMITGGEAMTLAQATETLAEARGSVIEYRQISSHQAREDFIASGRPQWFVDVLLELFAAFETGAVGLRTSTFQDLTGQTPKSFGTFAAEVAAA